MAWLALAAPYIAAATTALTVTQQVQAGQLQQAQGNVVAAQRERDANQAQVEAQAEAANERRRAKLVRSRALAVAGASGAGVSDPGVSSILSDIETEGEMNALTALHSGDYLARGLRSGADAARSEGRARRDAGYLSGATTALSGAVSWFDKYGDKPVLA
jgi:hypothetical protein